MSSNRCDCSKTCGNFNITTPINFGQQTPCDGAIVQVYKAFTKCLPTVTIEAFGGGGTPNCPYTLIVETKNDEHVIVIDPRERFIATFDCVERISTKCRNVPGSTCNTGGNLYISGCVSCCSSDREHRTRDSI